MKKTSVVWLLVLCCLAGCGSDTPSLSASRTVLEVGKTPLGLAPAGGGAVLAACRADGSVWRCRFGAEPAAERLAVPDHPVRLLRRGSRWFCFHHQPNVLSVLGGRPPRVIRTVRTGALAVAGGAVRPGTSRLWIADGVSSVRILSANSLKLAGRIHLGRYPQQVAFTPDGSRALVTLKGANSLAVIDAVTREPIAEIPVGVYPRDVLLVGGTACVSNFGSHDVSLVDWRAGKERARVKVRRKPNALAVRDGTLWVACEDSYRIVGVDLDRGEVVGSVRTGFYPGGLIVLPDGALVVTAPRRGEVVRLEIQARKPS